MATSQVGGLPLFNNTAATQVAESTGTGLVYATAGLASFVPKGGYDATTDLVFIEDFLLGSTSAPDIGGGWAITNATIAMTAGEANHPGIMTRSTGGTINTIAYMNMRTFETTGIFLPAATFDMTWIVRPQLDTTNISMKFGICDNPASLTPSNGIYVERLGTDTQWFGVTRSGGSQTRTAALITSASNTWFKFRIRRTDASTIGFTVNALSEVTATATIPTAAMQPFNVITNPAVGTPVTMDLDLFSLRISGMTR